MLFLAAASSASYLIIRSLETQVGEMPVGWTQLLFLGGGPMAYTVFFASCVYIAGVFPQRHALVVRRPRLAPALYITACSAVLIRGALAGTGRTIYRSRVAYQRGSAGINANPVGDRGSGRVVSRWKR